MKVPGLPLLKESLVGLLGTPERSQMWVYFLSIEDDSLMTGGSVTAPYKAYPNVDISTIGDILIQLVAPA